MNNFLSVSTIESVDALIQKAIAIKQKEEQYRSIAAGKTLAMLFMNPSTRTRMSTWRAAKNLGMEVISLNMTSDTWKLELEEGAFMNADKPEHIKDAANVIGQYCDIIGIRSFARLKNKLEDEAESVLNAFVNYSTKPVISLESACLHPLQSLADMMCISEHRPKQSKAIKVVLSWAPHIKPIPHAVANSFSEWVQQMPNIEYHICQPKGYELDPRFTQHAQLHYHQATAFEDADFIYFKNWSSYEQYGSMPFVSGNWLPNLDALAISNHAKIMHCMPVRRNVEVRDALLDAPNSLILQQAANRVYATMAVLIDLLNLQ